MGFVHHITAAGAATGWMEKSPSLAANITRAAPFPTPTNLIRTPIGATLAAGGAPRGRQNADSIPPVRLARIQGRGD